MTSPAVYRHKIQRRELLHSAAYFTGADQPYDKLKRALRARSRRCLERAVDISTPLKSPQPKIAVKVINHYGDEVLKSVYSMINSLFSFVTDQPKWLSILSSI